MLLFLKGVKILLIISCCSCSCPLNIVLYGFSEKSNNHLSLQFSSILPSQIQAVLWMMQNAIIFIIVPCWRVTPSLIGPISLYWDPLLVWTHLEFNLVTIAVLCHNSPTGSTLKNIHSQVRFMVTSLDELTPKGVYVHVPFSDCRFLKGKDFRNWSIPS